MIADLKPYPAMKDSGVAWLGDVPQHWDVLRGRRLFEIKKRIAGELGHPVISVTQAGLRVRNVETGEGQVSQDYSKYQIVQPGEFAMNSMDLLTGGVGIADSPGVTSPDYRVFVIRDDRRCSNRYMLHVLRMLYQNHGFYAWGQGSAQLGRWRLPRKRFNDFPFPVPPHEEQVAIVRCLDHVDRRVRRLVRAKRKLIALLMEQRQAFIHHAVTRGLDPDVVLVSSGNQWFPKVPANWQVLPMRRVIRQSIDGPHHSPQYLDEGVPFLSARNVKADRWSLDDVKYISEADYEEFSKRVMPEVGDVLYTKGGTTGVARAVDLKFRFQVWVHVAVLKLNKEKITPDYLAATLNTPRCYEQAQLYTRGATNQDLGLGRMKDIVLPVPPLDVQSKIMSGVRSDTTDLKCAIERAEHEIELLREYRMRLVSDAVTGKIDVGDAAGQLPMENERPMLVDDAGDTFNVGDEAPEDSVREEAEA